MNRCNPDSSTKTHISSNTKHVFFNNSSLQKIHISSHPEHVFFHKGSHILSLKYVIFQRLFHIKFGLVRGYVIPCERRHAKRHELGERMKEFSVEKSY